MDIKVSRNYAAYQKAVSNAKHTEKGLSAPVQAAGKTRGDAICISSEGVKKSGASSFVAALSKSMDEGAPADRIAAIKQQVLSHLSPCLLSPRLSPDRSLDNPSPSPSFPRPSSPFRPHPCLTRQTSRNHIKIK